MLEIYLTHFMNLKARSLRIRKYGKCEFSREDDNDAKKTKNLDLV